MSNKELELFISFIKNSRKYVEFGTGGSTFVASKYVEKWIISIDSSKEWICKVKSECRGNKTEPRLLFADIGPTGEWGYPTDQSTLSLWTRYHDSVWNIPESSDADLYVIDGRFRVACFAQTILHCEHTALIGLHDFTSRNQYRCVREIAREIATAEDMSFFQPLTGIREKAVKILDEYRLNPE